MNNASAMPRLLPRAPPCIPWPAQGMGGGAWLKLKRIRSLRNGSWTKTLHSTHGRHVLLSSKKRKEEDSEKKITDEKDSSRKNIRKRNLKSALLSHELFDIESQFSVRYRIMKKFF